jgi:DNA repair protein RecO (recombination protein O)
MSEKTLAFILHRIPFKETDLILKCLTPDFGVLSLLAKGAKRSKTQAYFEPFHLMEIEFFGQSELKKLRGLEPAETRFSQFRLQGPRLFSAFYLNELITYAVPAAFTSSLAGSGLFEAYRIALENLTKEEVVLEPLLRDFEIAVFRALGAWPDLSRDCRGEKVQIELFYDLQAGSAPSRSISGDFKGADLLNIACQDWSSSETLFAAKRLLRHWVSFYCEGKIFKSRECFAQSLN